jgi:hypothetical protein
VPHVSQGIFLTLRATLSSGQRDCALCGDRFELASAVAVLHVDDAPPRGYVCRPCLAGGPAKAAIRVRDRARRLREQAAQLLAMRGDAWTSMAQTARERADQWDELAGRVEGLAEWPIRSE